MTLDHLAALLKLLLYAGALAGGGAALAEVSLRSGPGAAESKGPWTIAAGGLTAVLAALAGALLLMRRLDLDLDRPSLEAVFGGPAGVALGAQVVGGLLLMVAAWRSALRPLRLAGSLLLLGSFGLVGHAGSISYWSGLLAAAHLSTAGWWLGGLLQVRQACSMLGAEPLAALVRRFSRQALLVVGAMVASGAILVFVLVSPTLEAWSTPYARTLALKIAAATGALAIANTNRTRFLPRLEAGQPGAARRLGRAVCLEIVLLAGTLAVTAWLTTYHSPYDAGS